jgi:hypothetical protein
VHAYDDEHYATLVICADAPERAGSIAKQFVAMMHLGYYPGSFMRVGGLAAADVREGGTCGAIGLGGGGCEGRVRLGHAAPGLRAAA